MDNLTICPCCGSDACSKNLVLDLGKEINSYLCWTCGFTTNDLMKDGSDFEKDNYGNTAELIKDLKQVHTGLAWYPKVINLHEKGMVFPEWNKRAQDWYWAAVKAIPVSEEEKEKYPIPNKEGEYYEYKMDMTTLKQFNERDFMEALDYIGAFKQ